MEQWSRTLPDRSEPRVGIDIVFDNIKFSEQTESELNLRGVRPLVAGVAEKARYAHYSALFKNPIQPKEQQPIQKN